VSISAQSGGFAPCSPLAHADARRHEQALLIQCNWIETHLTRFLPATSTANRDQMFERFKPIGELALGLYVLVGPANRQSKSPLHEWALDLGRQIVPSLDRAAADLDWRVLEQRSMTSRHVVTSLLVYPLLEIVTGNEFGCHAEVERLTSRRCLTPSSEYCFLNSLLSREDHDAAMIDCLAIALAAVETADRCSSSLLYDLTHAIFFLTHFGRRDPSLINEYRDKLCTHLGDFTLRRLQSGDFDLGAELLMCQLYVGRPKDRLFLQALKLLVDSVREDGIIPAPSLPDGMDTFDWCYHTTLVGLMALAEVLSAPQQEWYCSPSAVLN
jgi:hypothetical protein